MRGVLALPCFALVALHAVRVLAVDPADLPPSIAGATTTGTEGDTGPDAWRAGKARTFVSSTVDLGFGYFRPELALGWGKPHYAWLGVEGYPSMGAGAAAEYVGVRGALPWIDLRLGARYAFAYSRRFVTPDDDVSRDELESGAGPPSRYVALQAELVATADLGICHVSGVATVYDLVGVADGFWVFEESLHVVAEPPVVWRGRVGWTMHVGPGGFVSLGPVADLIGVPARESLVFRVGPSVNVRVARDLDFGATLALVAAGPDTLGLVGADAGQLGLRWRWATGSGAPTLPW